MKEKFGTMPTGQEVSLYTISCGELTAVITDLGATLVRMMVPDHQGNQADVVLGHDNVSSYLKSGCYFGATVGRNSNRVNHASFQLGNVTITMPDNENGNNLHSGPDGYSFRLWQVAEHTENSIRLCLHSPHGDQGMPGNANISVTYTLKDRDLRICYDAVSDRDTVFNFTNHSYFNLAGHDRPEQGKHQLLTIPGRFFNPDDERNIPTGELRSVEGTPMDFRTAKPICRDLYADYEPLKLQGGYDHNWEVYCNPCAILQDPESGRSVSVITDRPGIQLYSGNYIAETGKDGVPYGKHSGIALETQFYPDSVNHPEWPQPFYKAGEQYHSETIYRFSW